MPVEINSYYDTAEKISRRGYCKAIGAAALAAYVGSKLPRAEAQDEYKIDVPIALKPLLPEDLENGNWLKAEAWEDSIEKPYYPNISGKNYFRFKWGEEWTAALVDAVTDTDEKPYGGVDFSFDTYKLGESKGKTPGFYTTRAWFDSPGGNLKDAAQERPDLLVGDPFPPNTLHYTWSRGQSPIAGDNEARLKPHVLYGFLFSTKLLTSRYNEILFHTFLRDSKGTFFRYPPGTYTKLNFSTIPIPELWHLAAILAIVLAGTSGVNKIVRERKAITNST